LNYTRVTLAAVVVINVFVVLILAQGQLFLDRANHEKVTTIVEPVLADLLSVEGSPRTFQAYLERPIDIRSTDRLLAYRLPQPTNGYTLVVDASGGLWFDNRLQQVYDIAAVNQGFPPQPVSTDLPVTPRDRALFAQALRQGEVLTSTGLTRTVRVSPLLTGDGTIVGAVLMSTSVFPLSMDLVRTALMNLALAAIIVVLLGTVFGWYASNPLAKRIEDLSQAADAWSQGDLSRMTHDLSPDEIGQLARRLDRMALQLGDLLVARQALAGSRERNRIARELHDSVKQQLFAASMLLGAAKRENGDAAWKHLEGVERLVEEAKQELNDLIHELRPIAVEGRTLAQALEALVAGFALPPSTHIHLEAEPVVPVRADLTAALYRIAQEALSNAARHAGAEYITVRLRQEHDELVLEIEDDGRGFMPSSVLGRGVGLTSMQTRATDVGGVITIQSQPGEGTRIEARVPLSLPTDVEDEDAN